MTTYCGYNATTGTMRPLAHAGELGGDEVLRTVPEGWQPIQTAPRDGREILVWCADTKEMFVTIWSAKHQGWQFAIGPKDGPHICRPDLWMTLPATPEDTQ